MARSTTHLTKRQRIIGLVVFTLLVPVWVVSTVAICAFVATVMTVWHFLVYESQIHAAHAAA